MSVHGRLVQFADAASLSDAVDRLRDLGYTRLEAFTPYPVDRLVERIGPPGRRIPPVMLVAGLAGGIGTLALQYVAAAVDYPFDIGGRPPASWPAFVPAAVEVAILFAVVAGFVAFLAGSGLGSLYRPVFNVAWFEEASRDGFLLLVCADDPRWDDARVQEDVASLEPLRHAEVAA